MGLLDNFISKVNSTVTSGDANQNIIRSIYELINSNQVGGIDGLLRKLSLTGQGSIGESWVSQGKNKSITATQLNRALGGDVVGQFATKLGISNNAALSKLARYLPLIIDKLTPEGKITNASQMNIQDIIGSLLKN